MESLYLYSDSLVILNWPVFMLQFLTLILLFATIWVYWYTIKVNKYKFQVPTAITGIQEIASFYVARHLLCVCSMVAKISFVTDASHLQTCFPLHCK